MKECEKTNYIQAENQKDVWGKGLFPKKYYEKVVKPRYLENNSAEE